MIVISGALVLVALILLIIGVVGPDLTFVYASIGVSLVSLVFLVIGILQRRGETAPATEAEAPAPTVAEEPADSVTAVVSSSAGTSRRVPEEPPAAATADDEPTTGGSVLVVEGRPRYHVDGCRYLSGKSAEAIDLLDAREEGFTPCGVCKPDDSVAARTESAPPAPELEEQGEAEVVEEDVPGVEVAEPVRTATRTVAKTAAKKAPAKAAKAAPLTAPAVAQAPAGTTRSAVRTAAVPAPAAGKKRTAAKAPSKAATAAAAATPAAATAANKAGSVVVIPDRGKFHRPECRFVRDVDGAEVFSRAAAGKQGYAACGVCKP